VTRPFKHIKTTLSPREGFMQHWHTNRRVFRYRRKLSQRSGVPIDCFLVCILSRRFSVSSTTLVRRFLPLTHFRTLQRLIAHSRLNAFARHVTPEIHEGARQSDPHGRHYQRRDSAMAKEMHGDIEFEVTLLNCIEKSDR